MSFKLTAWFKTPMAEYRRWRIVRQAKKVLSGYDAKVTLLGPDAVGVMGDGRTYGPTIAVQFPRGTSTTEANRIAIAVINRVPGITRVMMDIN